MTELVTFIMARQKRTVQTQVCTFVDTKWSVVEHRFVFPSNMAKYIKTIFCLHVRIRAVLIGLSDISERSSAPDSSQRGAVSFFFTKVHSHKLALTEYYLQPSKPLLPDSNAPEQTVIFRSTGELSVNGKEAKMHRKINLLFSAVSR